MPTPSRKRLLTADTGIVIEVTDDGSRTVVRSEQGQPEDAYHSASGAVLETRHVYLENSGVGARLRGGRSTSVLEVGLGTGMGLLTTLEAAVVSGTPLRYVALENRWLAVELIRQLEPEQWIRADDLVGRFLGWRSELPESVPNGTYRWPVDASRQVEVRIGDARRWQPAPGERFDAIYFDPFAPASNPELWQPPVLARMRQCLGPDGRLASYCVSRSVRETFESVGFRVDRVPGPPGGKREVLVASRAG